MNYSPVEIVDIAKQLEDCGEAYYRAAAAAVRDPMVHKELSKLRDAEAGHSADFERLLGKLGSVESWRLEEGYLDYMRSLARERVFPSPAAAASAVKGLGVVDILKLAMRFEQASVTFFEGLRQMVPAEDVAIIDDLIAEEKEHNERLDRILSQHLAAATAR